MAAVVLARKGAQVTAFDLSPGYLVEARQRARANGVSVAFVQADGHHLPFGDHSFDRIWGNAILHHLEPRTAARELQRLLKPGGTAVFCEPWGGNPLLALARRPPRSVRMASVNGAPGLVMRDADGVLTVIAFTVDSGRITALDVMRNPDKLTTVPDPG